MHYGVKGMKWGHRKKYYNADGSLNAKGIKKYARAGYAQDSYNSNKTKVGKVYDKVTGAHKIGGDTMYNLSSAKANKARAEKYVADKKAAEAAKNTPEAIAARKQKQKKAMIAGAAVAGTALAAYGAYKLNQYVKTKNCEIAAKRGEDYARAMFQRESFNMSTRKNLTKGSVRVVPSAYARDYADRASNDSFRTAARNVANYKRSGKDLRDLNPVSWYNDNFALETVFDNSRRK